MSDLYSPRIGLHISLWNVELGLRPKYSFSGNICFEISVFGLAVRFFLKNADFKAKDKQEIQLHDRGQLTPMLKLLHLLFTTDLYFSLNIIRISRPCSSLFCNIFCLPSFLLSWCLPPSGGQNDDFRPLTYTLGGRAWVAGTS